MLEPTNKASFSNVWPVRPSFLLAVAGGAVKGSPAPAPEQHSAFTPSPWGGSCRFPSFFLFFSPFDYSVGLCLGISHDLCSICLHQEPGQGRNFTHKAFSQLQNYHPGSCFWRHKHRDNEVWVAQEQKHVLGVSVTSSWKDTGFCLHNVTSTGKKVGTSWKCGSAQKPYPTGTENMEYLNHSSWERKSWHFCNPVGF